METKIHLQLEDIYSDPYGFTYSEVAETIGEEQADKLCTLLLSSHSGYTAGPRSLSWLADACASSLIPCLYLSVLADMDSVYHEKPLL